MGVRHRSFGSSLLRTYHQPLLRLFEVGVFSVHIQQCMSKLARQFATFCACTGDDPRSAVRQYMRRDQRDITINDAKTFGFDNVETFLTAVGEYAMDNF